MNDKACGNCAHSHVAVTGLECRAMPPSVGEGRLGRFPGVRSDDYCHGAFRPKAPPPEADPEGPKTARARRASPDPAAAELPL